MPVEAWTGGAGPVGRAASGGPLKICLGGMGTRRYGVAVTVS